MKKLTNVTGSLVLGVVVVIDVPPEDICYTNSGAIYLAFSAIWIIQFQFKDEPKDASGMVYIAGICVYILDVPGFQDHNAPLLRECNLWFSIALGTRFPLNSHCLFIYLFIYLIYLFIYLFNYVILITRSYKTNLHRVSIKHDILNLQNIIKRLMLWAKFWSI